MSDELVNSERVTIVKGDPVRDFWLDGTVNRYPDYSFKAKVYDIGSIFGIGDPQHYIAISRETPSPLKDLENTCG
jgi:hypothetical protein